jgi:hypothetical protein
VRRSGSNGTTRTATDLESAIAAIPRDSNGFPLSRGAGRPPKGYTEAVERARAAGIVPVDASHPRAVAPAASAAPVAEAPAAPEPVALPAPLAEAVASIAAADAKAKAKAKAPAKRKR